MTGRSDLHRELDLDRCPQRQTGNTDGAANVSPGVTENLSEQLGGTIGHRWLSGEVGSAGNVDDNSDDPANVVDSTGCLLYTSDAADE